MVKHLPRKVIQSHFTSAERCIHGWVGIARNACSNTSFLVRRDQSFKERVSSMKSARSSSSLGYPSLCVRDTPPLSPPSMKWPKSEEISRGKISLPAIHSVSAGRIPTTSSCMKKSHYETAPATVLMSYNISLRSSHPGYMSTFRDSCSTLGDPARYHTWCTVDVPGPPFKRKCQFHCRISSVTLYHAS